MSQGKGGGQPQIYTKEFIEKEADAFEQWMKNPDNIFFKDFAFERGYDYRKYNEFAKVNEKFLVVYNKSKVWQESLLLKGGLKNKYNSNIVKFALSNLSAWSERQETKISGDSENPLNFILQTIVGNTKELVDEEQSE